MRIQLEDHKKESLSEKLGSWSLKDEGINQAEKLQ